MLTTYRSRLALLVIALLATMPVVASGAQLPPAGATDEKLEQKEERKDTDNHPMHPLHEIDDAMLRLPLAALLGAALALRPRRKGTPPRTAQVVQTQIVLSVVGAVIMLVVGASLARAFGIVGAANLIRYRSKIDDPKDAVVMLCALSVGLAAGVGLYALSAFSTVFLVVLLGIIESFEPKTGKAFDLKIKLGDETDERRRKVETILDRHKLEYELRTSSDEEVCYDVTVPLDTQTDPITHSILKLDPEGHAAVEWAEKKKKA
ncbi:hypothetical protein BH18ACI5_BH18ACI5_13690 [soil metagenome]